MMSKADEESIKKLRDWAERMLKHNPYFFDEDYVPAGQVCVEQINDKGEAITSHTFTPTRNKPKVFLARICCALGLVRLSHRILNSIEIP